MEINKEYIDETIVNLKKGEILKIEIPQPKVSLIRERIKRAKVYNIKMCFIKLYDNFYHLEKIEEGEKDMFLKRRRHRNKIGHQDNK